MKKHQDVDALAASLTTAAAQPLQAAAPVGKKPKAKTKQILLTLPEDLYKRLDAAAVERTKESGRGVSVQQVIMERLGDCNS